MSWICIKSKATKSTCKWFFLEENQCLKSLRFEQEPFKYLWIKNMNSRTIRPLVVQHCNRWSANVEYILFRIEMKSSVLVSFRGAVQTNFHTYQLTVASYFKCCHYFGGKSSNLTHIVFNRVVKTTARCGVGILCEQVNMLVWSCCVITQNTSAVKRILVSWIREGILCYAKLPEISNDIWQKNPDYCTDSFGYALVIQIGSTIGILIG